MCCFFFSSRRRHTRCSRDWSSDVCSSDLRLPRFTLAPVREILRVGVPAALSASVNNLGLMTLTAVVTRLGEADLAAYGLATRLDFLLMAFGYGFGAAVLTLVGMATGARRPDRARPFVTRAAAITVV